MLLVIEDLREIARCCQEGEPMNERLTRWLGSSLRSFLDQDARTIEEAMGLQAPPGGVPWHLEEALRMRDAALRELASGFCAADSLSGRAKQVHSWAMRYAASAWRFDRNKDDMPAQYRGTAKALLWRAFTSGARMPISERQLRNVLAP
jgi:hypothetical protein